MLDQLVMDHYTVLGGNADTVTYHQVIYQVRLHKIDVSQHQYSLNELMCKYVKTLWRCIMIAKNAPDEQHPEPVLRVLRHFGLMKTICQHFIDSL